MERQISIDGKDVEGSAVESWRRDKSYIVTVSSSPQKQDRSELFTSWDNTIEPCGSVIKSIEAKKGYIERAKRICRFQRSVRLLYISLLLSSRRTFCIS